MSTLSRPHNFFHEASNCKKVSLFKVSYRSMGEFLFIDTKEFLGRLTESEI